MFSHVERFYIRLREKLWVRPLIFCLLAVIAALASSGADNLGLKDLVPEIDHDTVEKLLSIIAASMLGVATFAVASMVSAYASVSSNATPRAFPLIVSDDGSKTVLSTFIAAFIFSVVALIAIKTDYYDRTGLFVLFVLTILILAWVVFAFIRWVDQIARLGRLRNTIDRVEKAAEGAIERSRKLPNLGARAIEGEVERGVAVYADAIGYVQRVDLAALQDCAQDHDAIVTIGAPPGAFVGPGRAIIYFDDGSGSLPSTFDAEKITEAFDIAHDRAFDEDPRFGLIALSEIAARALSPGVNDSGTAIDIIGVFVRLFAQWAAPLETDNAVSDAKFDRVRVQAPTLDDMFDDAFTAIARDGAGIIEVVIRLQKAFLSLASIDDPALRRAAARHAATSLARAEMALKLPQEIETVRALARKLA